MKPKILQMIAATFVLTSGASAQESSEQPLAKKAGDDSLAWGPCPPILPGACSIAVLHGDPAKPNADVFLKVGAGYDLPLHRHTSAERMILVVGRLRVQYQGAEPSMLDPGDYAFGPAGLAHDGKCVSATPCTLFIAFEGPVDALLAKSN